MGGEEQGPLKYKYNSREQFQKGFYLWNTYRIVIAKLCKKEKEKPPLPWFSLKRQLRNHQTKIQNFNLTIYLRGKN